MGVFARFFRRSKDSDGVSAEVTTPVTLTGEPEIGNAGRTDAPKCAKAEVTEAAEAEEAKAAVVVTEGVDIPRQQSAGEAADSETGEGART
ncbi:hypothetical protein [Streptomyces sp. NPDC020965]|uniref:hypothetical protein n=1 Tax=Streptomyces sp. NPDC020965 TaxID=3365105 RepID=UPI0037BB4419